MASNVFTQTVEANGEPRRNETLRLILRQAQDTRTFQQEKEEAIEGIVKNIRSVFDAHVDELNRFLKSQIPSGENKSEEEIARENEEFMKKYELIKVLMNEQKDFNNDFINQIGNYLVDSWNMIRDGKSDEECRKFAENWVKTYEAKAAETTAKIKESLQEKVTEPNGPKDEKKDNKEEEKME